jgi:hypothetical protein
VQAVCGSSALQQRGHLEQNILVKPCCSLYIHNLCMTCITALRGKKKHHANHALLGYQASQNIMPQYSWASCCCLQLQWQQPVAGTPCSLAVSSGCTQSSPGTARVSGRHSKLTGHCSCVWQTLKAHRALLVCLADTYCVLHARCY